jgi:hypothetical protein
MQGTSSYPAANPLGASIALRVAVGRGRGSSGSIGESRQGEHSHRREAKPGVQTFLR